MRAITGAVTLVLLLTAGGCPEDQSSPASLPDGVTTINKSMRGIWNAPGGPGCKWSVRVKSSSGNWTTIASGSGNKSQTVILGSSTVGGQLRSDKCKGWKK